eukprot:SAG31_NODE_497_length_14862_cov_6.951568_4_plen_86_part_00
MEPDPVQLCVLGYTKFFKIRYQVDYMYLISTAVPLYERKPQPVASKIGVAVYANVMKKVRGSNFPCRKIQKKNCCGGGYMWLFVV